MDPFVQVRLTGVAFDVLRKLTSVYGLPINDSIRRAVSILWIIKAEEAAGHRVYVVDRDGAIVRRITDS
jgi:hypothetical protein